MRKILPLLLDLGQNQTNRPLLVKSSNLYLLNPSKGSNRPSWHLVKHGSQLDFCTKASLLIKESGVFLITTSSHASIWLNGVKIKNGEEYKLMRNDLISTRKFNFVISDSDHFDVTQFRVILGRWEIGFNQTIFDVEEEKAYENKPNQRWWVFDQGYDTSERSYIDRLLFDYLAWNKYDEMEEKCLEYIDSGIEDAFLYNYLGLVHSHRENFAKAKECYLKASEIEPDNMGYKNNAEFDLEAAIKANP
ncbi:MAG: tetratricopeptide repeat protein [Bacteriovoracaceae bacterium]|nr:tetratricopeptide repeat protein [Bacteriovoracaceae bacterium]